jgi:hypothetical protein
MFPSKTPALYVLHMIAVAVIVALTLALTKNPLAILGLFFLPDWPVMQDPEQVERIQDRQRELDDADGGSGGPIGFM